MANDVSADRAFTLISPYEQPLAKPLHLKGQLHSHWFDDFSSIPLGLFKGLKIKSEGKFSITPEELDRRYHRLHYDFLAVTEHNNCGNWNPAIVTAPTDEVLRPPVFVHMLNCEEITPGNKHVLAIGLAKAIKNSSGKPKFRELAEKVVNGNQGVALLPHPVQYYKCEDVMREMTVKPGTTEVLFSAVAVRTAACHKEWFDDWDRLLRQGYFTRDGNGNCILVPGFAEDDYAPIGFTEDIQFITLGSTWISLEIDGTGWPAELSMKANEERSELIEKALKTGRWWIYWLDLAAPWKKKPYPKLTLKTDPAKGIIRLKSNMKLSKVKFIGSEGMTRPLQENRDVKAGKYIEYRCRGNEGFVRVVAKYIPDWSTGIPYPEMHILSNPVWVKKPEPEVRFFAVTPPPEAEFPVVRLDPSVSTEVLRDQVEIPMQVETPDRIVHAQAVIDGRVVGHPKAVDGVWKAKLDVSTVLSGEYELTITVTDSRGLSGSASARARVESAAGKPSVTVDSISPKRPKPGKPITVRGSSEPGAMSPAIVGIEVGINDKAATLAEVKRTGSWICKIPGDDIKAGTNKLKIAASNTLGHIEVVEHVFEV